MWKTTSLSLLIAAVFLLHQDVWNWPKTGPLFLGFLPVGIAYHAGYCVAAAVLMAVLVKFAWPRELDRIEAGDKKDDAAPKP